MLRQETETTPWVRRALLDDRLHLSAGRHGAGARRATGAGADTASLGLEWCCVPGADLVLVDEDDDDGDSVGLPVTVSTFEMTRTPVSNAQYDAFVAAGGYADEAHWTVHGWRYRRTAGWTGPATVHDPDRDPAAPVTGVSWWEAMAFACWAGALLPSEAQWELAARHGGGPASAPVAASAGSPIGRLDMNAGVAEWCLDNDRGAVTGTAGPLVDPVHESSETAPHVARGGCGLHDAAALCGNSRDHYAPGHRDHLIGFRLVRPA